MILRRELPRLARLPPKPKQPLSLEKEEELCGRAEEGVYSSQSCYSNPVLTASDHGGAEAFETKDGGLGGPIHFGLKPTISITTAAWQISYAWIVSHATEIEWFARGSSAIRTPLKQGIHALSDPPGTAAQAAEMEVEKNPDLALAILAQSQALSTLVNQMASGDLTLDNSSGLGMSIKGAQGRAKLQQELALHRGTFFKSVFCSMARRMQPAQAADLNPADLGKRGVVATQYVERFGGFGRSRDLGHIMWQVAMILDHLQNENIGAAKDGVALLAVCLEQAALDGGRLEDIWPPPVTAGGSPCRSLRKSESCRLLSGKGLCAVGEPLVTDGDFKARQRRRERFRFQLLFCQQLRVFHVY